MSAYCVVYAKVEQAVCWGVRGEKECMSICLPEASRVSSWVGVRLR